MAELVRKKKKLTEERDGGGGWGGADNYDIMLLVLGSGIELKTNRASLMAQQVEESTSNAGDTCLILGSGRSPRGRKWQPTPVFFPGKAHGQRSLAGYSPKGHKELDTTERLCIHAKTNKEYLHFMFREYLNMSSQLLRFGTRIFTTYMAQKSP